MELPLVSIGMPVRNGEEFIEEALHSLLNQTFSNFELIISDNASDDATAEICEAFCKRDKRIRFSRFENNVGAAKNYNHVFNVARGRYFKWAAHDDLCCPEFLEKCIAQLSADSNAVAVYPRTELIDENGRTIGIDEISLAVADALPHVRLRNFLQTVHLANPICGLIRSEALRRTRLIGSFVKSDVVLLAELLMMGEFKELPEILFRRRLHEKRSVRANPSDRDLLAWFDPSARDHHRWVSVGVRLSWEYALSVSRIPMRSSERLHCLAVIARWQWLRAVRSEFGRYRRKLSGSQRFTF